MPLEEVAGTMNRLIQSGKIKAVGVSNFNLDQIKEFAKYIPINALQPPLNLFERAIEENGVFDYANTHQISVLAYRPLCGGILSGTINANTKFNDGDIRNFDPKLQEPHKTQYINAIMALNEFAKDKYNKNILSLAIRWLLDKRSNIIALYGARKPWQLDALSDIKDWQLTLEDFNIINSIINRHIINPIGLEWLIPPARIEYVE